jgi:hypothetical protein
VKVVDVYDVIGRREESAELSTILSLLLLSGNQGSSGTQGTSGTQGISLDNPLAAFLLVQALFPSGDRGDEFFPLLVAILGSQGYGTPSNVTQGNILILPLILALSRRRRWHPGRDKINWEEIMETIEQQQGSEMRTRLENLVDSAARALDRLNPEP